VRSDFSAARRTKKKGIFALSYPVRCSQFEDQVTIHPDIELEVEVVQALGVADCADIGSGLVGTCQQLKQRWRCTAWAICIADTMPATLAAQMLAQQLTAAWIEQPHEHRVPLHVDLPPDPARRRSVISRFNLDATIDMHRPLAILVVAERLQRKRLQVGFSSANIAATCRLVRPWMRLSAQRSSQWSRYACASSRLSNFLPLNGVFWAWATPDSTFPFRSGSRTLHGNAVTP